MRQVFTAHWKIAVFVIVSIVLARRFGGSAATSLGPI